MGSLFFCLSCLHGGCISTIVLRLLIPLRLRYCFKLKLASLFMAALPLPPEPRPGTCSSARSDIVMLPKSASLLIFVLGLYLWGMSIVLSAVFGALPLPLGPRLGTCRPVRRDSVS